MYCLRQSRLASDRIARQRNDQLDRLPEKSPVIVQPPPDDAIATMIENPDGEATGSIPDQTERR